MRPAFSSIEPFDDDLAGPAVHGFLHRPSGPSERGLVLTHGAGSDCDAPILVAVAEAFARAGYTVLRCDLPFRQARAVGPPSPATAARDREGLRRAVQALRPFVTGTVSLGGHSYGGRQASVLAADDPTLADALLLLSYPLHPPRRPKQLRTQHFGSLRTPTLFARAVHEQGGRSIAGRSALVSVEGGGHDLVRGSTDLPLTAIIRAFGDLRSS